MNLSVRLFTAGRMLPQPWRCFSRAAEDLALQRIRKVLCVAEKNDAARGIAELLSNSRMRRVGTPHIVLLHGAWRQGWLSWLGRISVVCGSPSTLGRAWHGLFTSPHGTLGTFVFVPEHTRVQEWLCSVGKHHLSKCIWEPQVLVV